jgi:hypothetical protein
MLSTWMGSRGQFLPDSWLAPWPPKITAADPVHTELLGDFLFGHKEMPAECSRCRWLTRHLFRGYTAIECDSQVWSRIEGLIDQNSSAEQATAAIRRHGALDCARDSCFCQSALEELFCQSLVICYGFGTPSQAVRFHFQTLTNGLNLAISYALHCQ